jgi:hypothetical protein
MLSMATAPPKAATVELSQRDAAGWWTYPSALLQARGS